MTVSVLIFGNAQDFAKQWFFTPTLRTRIRRLTPVLVAVAGLWIVVRGVLIQPPEAGGGATSK